MSLLPVSLFSLNDFIVPIFIPAGNIVLYPFVIIVSPITVLT